jgi:hypothetical protein
MTPLELKFQIIDDESLIVKIKNEERRRFDLDGINALTISEFENGGSKINIYYMNEIVEYIVTNDVALDVAGIIPFEKYVDNKYFYFINRKNIDTVMSDMHEEVTFNFKNGVTVLFKSNDAVNRFVDFIVNDVDNKK